MADQVFDNVQCRVVRNAGQQAYQLGAVINGVFVVFAARGLGGVDDDLARAAAAAPVESAPAPGPDETPV